MIMIISSEQCALFFVYLLFWVHVSLFIYRKLKDEKLRNVKGGEWLATPNVYLKQEETETGPFAKKITKVLINIVILNNYIMI